MSRPLMIFALDLDMCKHFVIENSSKPRVNIYLIICLYYESTKKTRRVILNILVTNSKEHA